QAEQPVVSQDFEADICWIDTKTLDINQMYFLQQHGKVTKVKLQDVVYKINVNTLEKSSDGQFGLNDIGKVQLKTANPIALDEYSVNKSNGGAILIDSRNNLTVAALMISGTNR